MGGEIKLSPDLELAERQKVHDYVLQAVAHYGDPLTGETQEDRLSRASLEFLQSDFIREHHSQLFGQEIRGG